MAAVGAIRNQRDPGGALRSLRVPAFRRFWIGASCSNIGSTTQLTAVAWVAQEQTGSALKVTLITMASIVMILVLSPFGGALADRRPRRTVIGVGQWALLAQALTLVAVWAAGYRQYWLLFAITLGYGAVQAVVMPSWNSYVSGLVPPEQLQNAITLNSLQFNVARAGGPVLAGVLIAAADPGWCFVVNALSFLAVLWALRGLPLGAPPDRLSDDRPSALEGLRQAVRHARERPGVGNSIIVHMWFAAVGIPVTALLPTFADEVLGVGAETYGILLGSVGVGAIATALLIGTIDRRVPPRQLITGALAAGALGLGMLASATGPWTGVVALVVFGACYVGVVVVDHGALQRHCDDALRGRVSSLWLQSYGIAYPIGLVVQGLLVDAWGARPVLTIDAALLGLVAVLGVLTGRAATLDDPSTVQSGPLTDSPPVTSAAVSPSK